MKQFSKKIETSLKNFFLKILLLLLRAKKADSDIQLPPNPRILLIRLNRLGDALVITPLIKLIKKQFDPVIYVLADEKNHFAFSSNKDVDKVIIFRKGVGSFFEIRSYLNAQKMDIIIDTHDDVSFTVSMMIGLLRSRYKLALRKKNSPLFTHTVEKPDPSKTHVIDRLLSIAKILNIAYNQSDINVVYEAPETSRHKSENFLQKRFPGKKFTLGINISAGSEARFWGISNFRKLEQWLTENYDLHIIFICSTRDVKFAFQITVNQGNVFFTPDFDEFVSMIAKLDLLFSPDTATIHVASAYQIPVFGLYVQYNTTDIIWYPYRSDFDCVITQEPNLDNVTFEEVIEKFKPFLEKHFR